MKNPITVIGALLLCLFFAETALAQQNSTKFIGRVLDQISGKPLQGADVFLVDLKLGTTTDEDGYFEIRVPAGHDADSLAVNYLGYNSYRVLLSAYQNRSTIRLNPESLSLQDSILVSAERLDLVRQEIPHSRTTLNLEVIERQGSGEISDLLKVIPSVRVEGNDISGRQIQIRGSDANEVNVYVDGILINSLGLENAADLSLIPTESIEKLEVLKGSNLALLGSGAFGGVVNVTTKRNLDRTFQLKTKQGSFASQYYIADVNLPITKRLVFNYFGQLHGIEPEIEFFPGEIRTQKSTNNDIDTRKQNHHASLAYYPKNGVWTTRFFGYFLDYEKPLWQNLRKNYLLTSSYRGDIFGSKDWDATVSYIYSDDEIERERIADGRIYDDLFDAQRFTAKLLKKFISEKNEFQFFTEYYHDELDRNTGILFNNARSSVYQALVYENRISFGGVAAFTNQLNNNPNWTWKTHIGMRGDILAVGDKYISPTAGVQFSFDLGAWKFTPHANYGRNIKFPSLLDNAYVFLVDLNSIDTSTVRLEPEENNAFEIGVNTSLNPDGNLFRELEANFAVFRNTAVNKLLDRPFEELTILDQVGRNETTGIEGSLIFHNFMSLFTLSGSFTFLDVSNPLLYAFKPENSWSTQLDYVSDFGFYLTATYFFEGQSLAWFPVESTEPGLPFDIGTQRVDSAHDMDMSVGYKFALGGLGLSLQAAGYNIFDNSGYRDYLLKKRSFQVSLGVRM